MMEVGPRKLMDFVEIWCVIENVFLATTDESLGRSMRIPTEEQPRKIWKCWAVHQDTSFLASSESAILQKGLNIGAGLSGFDGVCSLENW